MSVSMSVSVSVSTCIVLHVLHVLTNMLLVLHLKKKKKKNPSPAAWAATFCLQGFNLMYAVCFVWPYHLMWGELFYDRFIFNIRTNCGCMPYTRRGVRHKQVCTRVDSEGQKNYLSFTLPRQEVEHKVFRLQIWCSSTELRFQSKTTHNLWHTAVRTISFSETVSTEWRDLFVCFIA